MLKQQDPIGQTAPQPAVFFFFADHKCQVDREHDPGVAEQRGQDPACVGHAHNGGRHVVPEAAIYPRTQCARSDRKCRNPDLFFFGVSFPANRPAVPWTTAAISFSLAATDSVGTGAWPRWDPRFRNARRCDGLNIFSFSSPICNCCCHCWCWWLFCRHGNGAWLPRSWTTRGTASP